MSQTLCTPIETLSPKTQDAKKIKITEAFGFIWFTSIHEQ